MLLARKTKRRKAFKNLSLLFGNIRIDNELLVLDKFILPKLINLEYFFIFNEQLTNIICIGWTSVCLSSLDKFPCK